MFQRDVAVSGETGSGESQQPGGERPVQAGGERAARRVAWTGAPANFRKQIGCRGTGADEISGNDPAGGFDEEAEKDEDRGGERAKQLAACFCAAGGFTEVTAENARKDK